MRGAANTQRAYAGDWQRFTAWCQAHELDSLSASVEALAGFLTELAEAGKKVATIQRHAAAIAKAHQLASLESPTADSKVKVLPRASSARSRCGLSKRPHASQLQAHGQKH